MLKNDFEVVFVTRETSTITVIPENYCLKKIPATVPIDEEPNWLKVNCNNGSLIIADGYHFVSNYQKQLKKAGFKLLYIDDVATEHFFADAVINHAPKMRSQQLQKEPFTGYYQGLKYAMLRPQFLKAAVTIHSINDLVEEVFVCFGGADMYDLSFKASQALLTFKHIKKVHVVLGGAYTHTDIEAFAETSNGRLELHRNITAEQMLIVMNRCDFAIAPASTIIYELCCVTMPVLGGFYVENQRQIYEGLLVNNVIFEGGDFSNETVKSFRSKISECFKKDSKTLCKNQSKLFDGRVKDRFVKLAKAYCENYRVRNATKNDLQLFYEWANDELTRKMSFSSSTISLTDHTRWFENQLKNTKTYLLVLDIETAKSTAPVGNIKFDTEGVIGISLDAAYRGKGLGALLINKGLEYIAKTKQYPIIFAFIKEDNTSSRTIFEQAGFKYAKMSNVRGIPCLEYQYQLTN